VDLTSISFYCFYGYFGKNNSRSKILPSMDRPKGPGGSATLPDHDHSVVETKSMRPVSSAGKRGKKATSGIVGKE
jgi:hypothetical protein